MAALQPSSSESSHSSNDSDKRSSSTNYGHIADEPEHVVYRDGSLTWSGGKLRDEDIITVTEIEGGSIGHIIWSLAPIDSPAESGQPPFELRSTSATNIPQDLLNKYLYQSLPSHLDPDRNDLYVLISTLSGTGLAPDFFEEVLHPLFKAIGLTDSRYNIVRTKSDESVKKFALSVLSANANKGKKQSVVMLSGDGGIVDSINGLLESGTRSNNYVKPVFAQLPLGTGNALFHSLHRPSPFSSIYIQGLRTIFNGDVRPLPLFRAKFSPGARLLTNEGRTATALHDDTLYGAVVASYGLHATLVADSDTTEYRKHGAKRFELVANDLLFPQNGAAPHPYKAKVTLVNAGGTREPISRQEHGYILASLVSNLEKTFTISPASKPLDGQLRVIQFGPLTGQQTMEVMKEAYNNGNHTGIDGVGYESIEGLRIDFKEEGMDWKWRRCCIDGLIVGVEQNGWIEVDTIKKGDEAIDIVIEV